MQKVINTIALLSGLVSLSVVGAGAYLYVNKDAIIEDIKMAATVAVSKAVAESLPGMIDEALPEIPEMTGDVIPSGKSSSGSKIKF